MAKVEATKSYGAERRDGRRGARGGDRGRASSTSRRRARRSSTPTRTRSVVAGQGTIGLELAEQVPERRDGARPDRRRRARVRDRAALARCGRRRGWSACAPRRTAFAIADGIAVKQPGRAHRAASLTTLLDDDRRGRRRGDRPGDRAARSSARSSSSRAPARSGSRALLEGKVGGSGPVAVVLSGGNIDASTLIAVMRARAHARRPPPGRADLRSPTGRASCSKLLELVAKERVNVLDGRAPARGRRHPGRRDRDRADAARPATRRTARP